MKSLGKLFAMGALDTGNRVTPGTALWVAQFDPALLPRIPCEVWHGALTGPVGGYFLVYIDDALFDVGSSGPINAYNPDTPLYLMPGQQISLHWSIPDPPAPQVWLWFREPPLEGL